MNSASKRTSGNTSYRLQLKICMNIRCKTTFDCFGFFLFLLRTHAGVKHLQTSIKFSAEKIKITQETKKKIDQ